MAKIKMGAIVVAISGKLGGHVFARNAGGEYMRTKSTPTNPQTAFQSAIRALFASISSSWSGLSEAARNSFRDKVDAYKTTNVFGDLKKPTAKSLFQRLNLNLGLTGQALLTQCPDPSEVPSAQISNAVASVGGTTFTVDSDGDTTGMKLLVSATPSLSQGKKFVKNDLRDIGVIDGGNGAQLDIQADYVARFGQPAQGANIYVAVTTVNANGQASPKETIKATIGA